MNKNCYVHTTIIGDIIIIILINSFMHIKLSIQIFTQSKLIFWGAIFKNNINFFTFAWVFVIASLFTGVWHYSNVRAHTTRTPSRWGNEGHYQLKKRQDLWCVEVTKYDYQTDRRTDKGSDGLGWRNGLLFSRTYPTLHLPNGRDTPTANGRRSFTTTVIQITTQIKYVHIMCYFC